MGAIKNIWKRFKGFIIGISIFLSLVSGVATIAKIWDDVWKIVTAILNFLISTDGRQIILSLLVVVLLIKLVRLNRKINKLSPSKEKGTEKEIKSLREDIGKHKLRHKEVTQKLDGEIRKLRQDLSQIYDKAKKYEQIEIEPEYIFILETLGARLDRTFDQNILYRIYLAKYDFDKVEEAKLNFNMIIEWLEKNGYIRMGQAEDEDGDIFSYYEITTNGFEYLRLTKKKVEEEKKKIEEEEKKPL